MPAEAGFERVAVGDCCALYRAADGMLALANDAAARGSVAPPARLPAPALSFPDAALQEIGTLALGSRSARIATNDDHLAALLVPVLAPLACSACAEAPLIRVARRESGTYAIARHCSPAVEAADLSEARHQTLRALLLELIGDGAVGAILHASALAGEEGALVLAGESGAGKSTLAAGLAASGFALLADDLVPLDRAGLSVAAFPVATSVKSGSRAVVRRHFPGIDACPAVRTRNVEVRYLDLAGERAARWAEARALIFPLYRAGARTRLECASPEEAFAFLAGTGSEPAGTPLSIAPLAGLVRKVPAFHMEYSSLEEAVALLASLPGGPR